MSENSIFYLVIGAFLFVGGIGLAITSQLERLIQGIGLLDDTIGGANSKNEWIEIRKLMLKKLKEQS